MSFDDAISFVLAHDGNASKTESSLGYVARNDSGSGVGLLMRYRPFNPAPYPRFCITVDPSTGKMTSSSPSSPVVLDAELLREMLLDDWMESTSAECEEAASKRVEYAGLKFTAVDPGAEVSFVFQTPSFGTYNRVKLKKSTDGGLSWENFVDTNEAVPGAGSVTKTIVLSNVGDSVYIRAEDGGNQTFGCVGATRQFEIKSGKVSASGDITSLIDETMSATSVPDYAFYRLFLNCSDLVSAPELPAVTLGNYCYYEMFEKSGIAVAPSLPASVVPVRAYCSMFHTCRSLTDASAVTVGPGGVGEYGCLQMFCGCIRLENPPSLPAVDLGANCYYGMFSLCSDLEVAPELPSDMLADFCYAYMFSGCESLLTAPALESVSLAPSCYFYMFCECTSLQAVPLLPATVPEDFCYACMFYGCTGLTGSAQVNLTYFDNTCQYMFYRCSGLTEISIPNVQSSSWGYLNWVYGVSASGTFKCQCAVGFDDTITKDVSHCPPGWTVQNIGPAYGGLRFDSTVYGSSIALERMSTQYDVHPLSLKYSFDGRTWNDYEVGTYVSFPSSRSSVYFRATAGGNVGTAKMNAPRGSYYENIGFHRFSVNGHSVSAKGNVMSLLDASLSQSSVPACAFYSLFSCCNITSAPDLPATQLSEDCYRSMFEFSKITSLMPVLPALSVPAGAYEDMFSNCGSLVDASGLDIKATYAVGMSEMFSLCTKLKKSPILRIAGGGFEGCAKLFYYDYSLERVETYQTVVPQPTQGYSGIGFTSWLYGVKNAGTIVFHELTEQQVRSASGYPSVSTVPSGWTIVGKQT